MTLKEIEVLLKLHTIYIFSIPILYPFTRVLTLTLLILHHVRAYNINCRFTIRLQSICVALNYQVPFRLIPLQ